MSRKVDGLGYFLTPASTAMNYGLNNVAQGAFTLSAWIAPSANPKDNSLMGILAKDPATSASIWFGVKADLTGFLLRARVANAGTAALALASTIIPGTDGLLAAPFNHIAVTYDSADKILHLYLNGDEVSYGTNTTGAGAVPDDSAGPWVIGSDLSVGFVGEFVDVRLYRAKLVQSEIVDDLRGGKLKFGNLISRWRMCGRGPGLHVEPDDRGFFPATDSVKLHPATLTGNVVPTIDSFGGKTNLYF
jgi:hypothetical protein